MKNIYKLSFIFISIAVLCLSGATAVFAQQVGGVTVQTSSATNISNYQATLNGYLGMPYLNGSNYVYFQWGTTTNYGNQTPQLFLNNSGPFGQNITGLANGYTYHYRAVAQGGFGIVYGQDVTFYAGQSNNGNALTANAGSDLYLTSGQITNLQGSGYSPNGYPLNYYWSCTGGALSSYNIAQPTYTAPYNYNNQQTTYTCTLTVSDSYGNSNSDSVIIYINSNNNIINNYNNNYVQTDPATNVSSVQATLNGYLNNPGQYGSSSVYFQWGRTEYVYGSQTNPQYMSSAGAFSQVISNFDPNVTYHFRAVVQGNFGIAYGQDMTFTTFGTNIVYVAPQVLGVSTGPTNVSTGLTNDILKDSFFIPLLIILFGLWFYFSGEMYVFSDKLKAKFKK